MSRKFKVHHDGTDKTFRSENKAYEHVRNLTAQYAEETITESIVRVFVDEGQGWQRFEKLDLAEQVRLLSIARAVRSENGA